MFYRSVVSMWTLSWLLIFYSSEICNAHNLVNIKTINPCIELDIKYATSDNFTKSAVYTKAACYVINEITYSLDAVAKELQEQGYRLKV